MSNKKENVSEERPKGDFSAVIELIGHVEPRTVKQAQLNLQLRTNLNKLK